MPGSMGRISTLVKARVSSLLDRADRQLEQIGAERTVDDELARLKAEHDTPATRQ